MKKYISLAVKVIDNEGDPEWCFKKNKRLFCSKELHKTLILEYKRRIIVNIYHLLKRKSLTQIKTSYMKKWTKKKFLYIKSKEKLIHALLICLHKKSWKKLKQFEQDFYMVSKTRKQRGKRKSRRTRRKK